MRMPCLNLNLSSCTFIHQSREILDGLCKVSFRLNTRILGTGAFTLGRTRAGDHYLGTWIPPPHTEFSQVHFILSKYLDSGGSELIAEGKIKLKNDTSLEGFTETGLKFGDGSELQADVVVFATTG